MSGRFRRRLLSPSLNQTKSSEDGFWHNGNFFAWAPPVTKPPPARIPSRFVVAAILHDPTKILVTETVTITSEKATAAVEVPSPPRPATQHEHTSTSTTSAPQTIESKPADPNTFVSHNGHAFAWAPPVTKRGQQHKDRAATSQPSSSTVIQPTVEHSFSHNGHSYAWASPVTSRQPKPHVHASVAQSKPDTTPTTFSNNGHSFEWASSETKRQSHSATTSQKQTPGSWIPVVGTPMEQEALSKLKEDMGAFSKKMEGTQFEKSMKELDEKARKTMETISQTAQEKVLPEGVDARIRDILARSSRSASPVRADQSSPPRVPLRSSPPRSFQDFRDELVEARRLAVSSIARNREFANRTGSLVGDLGNLTEKLLAVTSKFMDQRVEHERRCSQSNSQCRGAQDPTAEQILEQALPSNATTSQPFENLSRGRLYKFPDALGRPGGKVPSRYTFTADPVAKPESVVKGQGHKGHYRFSILTDKLVRFEWSEDGGFEDRASTTAFFRSFPTPEFKVDDDKDKLEIVTKYFHLTYNKSEFSFSGLTVKAGNDIWHYDGKSYGDLGGTARTLDRADGRIPLEPGILSRKAYAVLDDSASMLFEDGWIATRKPGRKDGYLFAYHGDHKAAIKDFYRLSGGQPLLPRWALGNWWSRYHAYSDSEYLGLMNKFASEKIPLSVAVIDMDWHKVDIPRKYGSGWTGYSWNRDLFPYPKNFIEKLHQMGLKVTVNDHPADGIRAFEDQYKLVAKALGHDTSKEEPIRFDCTDKKFLDAYFDVLKQNLEDEGIDFWWIDWQQGNRSRIPGVDPLWVLNHYHYLTSRRNVHTTSTPITFSRYAGAGSHRYPIGFSGDTLITWASLNFQPEFTATASNIGYGWWSHDIGGHYAGVRSNELTARWLQFGCFSPILRLHSEKSQWNSKEPWLYEPEARKVMKDHLQLRYRLIPFLYTMNVRATYESEPLMQPMYWNHKDDEEAYTVPNQYYFGPDLIVAPITTPNNKSTLMGSVRAWLPPSNKRYIDIRHPSLVYDGGRYIDVHRPLSEIPVFAKEGTILPLDTAKFSWKKQHGVACPKAITIQLVVGADAYFELVEPPLDEEIPAAEADRPDPATFTRTPIRWNQKAGILTIGPETNPYGSRSRAREWTVELLGCTNSVLKDVEDQAFEQAKLHGCAFPSLDSEREPHAEHNTTVYLGPLELGSQRAKLRPDNTNPNRNYLDVTCTNGSGSKEFRLGKNLQLDVTDIEKRVHEVLYRAEMAYPKKQEILDLVTRDRAPVKERVERLWRMGDVDEGVKKAVLEIWGADGRSEGNAVGCMEALGEVVNEENEEEGVEGVRRGGDDEEWDEDARSEQSYEFV
ncbi:glycosyl hydrolases family 31-domain-containing protein [Sordaria brevicollis]|uniref:alpha-glucosidase n=1 Tax=Sordaria brevicollis TaxID=83679 RepID=A0AAE0UDS2_SORBR|nr:glycosyl hydrolases family 31-domain-containing protein [Sordaria brevicollis]